ncbi:MAG: class B sortase [Lachnospiraceae bacterium]|nr:class B sortase [Lachnospiraceae bacterium]
MENITENTERTQQNSPSNKIGKIIAVSLIVLAAISLAVFGIRKLSQNAQEQRFEELAAQNTIPVEAVVTPAAKPESTEPEPTESEPESKDNLTILEKLNVPIPEKEVDFAKLQTETNPDIYAWIYIPDSMIDYPVLQHPTDNTHYLDYNLDGSKGYPGCIYTENYNKKDFSDPVTVLYGHNMKKGTMFAGLHKYEDAQYFEEHPYVYIYTPEKLLVYQIFASCEYSDKHILLSHDFSKAKEVEDFLGELTSYVVVGNNYNKGVEVTSGDNLLVLSTCIGNKPNNRYLVAGVLLNAD